ncbi:MAG: hypothetical protein LBG72_10190 [Spirochaetaceae bacterium]|jgi:hypothetical protein|nr:hypothetical protein [Spirochaetaceae bacterium]
MAEKAIYAHGELDAVKKRLGPISEDEARRMKSVLGGEVGRERAASDEDITKKHKKHSAGGKKPTRIIETADIEKELAGGAGAAPKKQMPVKASFYERVKMDALCGDAEFGIKTWFQVLRSRFSLFSDPPDLVSSWFLKRILQDYCYHLDFLVTRTRLLFPRNNFSLTEKLKSASHFSFRVLDTIRRWNIETIDSERNRLQRRGKNVYISDFNTLIYEIYKPVYILERLEIYPHIESVYNNLYRLLFLENASAETEKKKEIISKTILAYQFVCKNMRRHFYPIFMKLVSSKFYFYDEFFSECADAVAGFLGVSDAERLQPPKEPSSGGRANAENEGWEQEGDSESDGENEDAKNTGEEGAEEEKAEEEKPAGLSPNEQKAFDKGLKILDSLFPRAGWLAIDSFPDLIPYFQDVTSLPKGAEFIAPEDPSGIVLVLGAIIEKLLYGFRKIQFTTPVGGTLAGLEGRLDESSDPRTLGNVLDDWQKIMEEAFERQYIPRIQECSQYSQNVNQRNKLNAYSVKIHSALHWTRRYYFFPFYNYMDKTPPPFKKSEINALYPFVRNFRKKLTTLAAYIDKAVKMGGRENAVSVDGIGNPWDGYVFQIENPLSKRLNMLLGRSQRDNVSLIFFTLALVTVLDDIMNDGMSFAYNANFNKLFRTGEDGETPVVWIEKVSNTLDIFKQTVMERAKK